MMYSKEISNDNRHGCTYSTRPITNHKTLTKMKTSDKLLATVLLMGGVFFLSLIKIVPSMDTTSTVMAVCMSGMMFFSVYLTYKFNN